MARSTKHKLHSTNQGENPKDAIKCKQILNNIIGSKNALIAMTLPHDAIKIVLDNTEPSVCNFDSNLTSFSRLLKDNGRNKFYCCNWISYPNVS